MPHGDADIGTLQGGRVVHPVAGHRRHLPVGLHRLDQAQLVLGAGAGEDVDLAHSLAECRFIQGFDLGAGQRPVACHPHPHGAGNGGGGHGMVAGDHLDADAGGMTGRHSADRLLAWRVHDAGQGEQGQAAFDIGKGQFALPLPHRRHGQREDAIALRRQRVDPRLPVCRGDRLVLAGSPLPGAHADQALRRALDEDEGMPGMVVMQRRHETVLGFEGNDIDARQGRGLEARIQPGLHGQRQQRAFGRIAFEPPFTVGLAQDGVVAEQGGTGDVGQFATVDAAPGRREGAARGIADAGNLDHPLRRHQALNGHFIPGQRAGLVGTDGRHRAQRFHRRHAADDGVAPRHPLHADGQGDGHDRRQAFGNRRHGEADGGEEHLAGRLAMHQHAEGDGAGGQRQDAGGQPAAELRHLLEERRIDRFHVG